MKRLTLFKDTELFFGEEIVKDLLNFKNKVVIADKNVESIARQIDAPLILIEAGEKAKNWHVLQELVDKLTEMGVDRSTTIIAMGGGTICDLVGFLSSIYLRGVPLILVPTTLLAIVDASIGGKTGINTSFGKNRVGSIYLPKMIIADLSFLKTLPEKEMFNGRAEIWKMGLISDVEIWEKEDIFEAMQAKIKVVEKDLKEGALRKILNFGHTIAHALEKVTDFTMPHGLAVAMGTATESHLSHTLGYLKEEEFIQIKDHFASFSLRLPKTYEREKLLSAMQKDKKRKGEKTHFVLIDQIGHAIEFGGEYSRAVDDITVTLDWMEKEYAPIC